MKAYDRYHLLNFINILHLSRRVFLACLLFVCNGTKIPLTTTAYGEVQGLPDQRDDTVLIVSSMVAARCKDRTDVFIPNESIRDAEGRIIGCKSLGRV